MFHEAGCQVVPEILLIPFKLVPRTSTFIPNTNLYVEQNLACIWRTPPMHTTFIIRIYQAPMYIAGTLLDYLLFAASNHTVLLLAIYYH